ncbi:50S ribosomal protein L23 [Candidatus Adlerbacteria bacterium RIFCSPHIGHO2_02_FULL_54_18]|uniref:50S ribosomal protein L23 n=2 Tax=Candidatus Adleribacteriota TaxID=1752736 RepID=A0A1F4Y353_9BACT|nr:MAG: 50S ribosomal protein L23 [Candidatus Adlerbacteria bacterium RIFCSPLOWO2_01_FULL_54_21b]OGC88379.1 MAG: 50S ribosomal protein L23 [Candidatus Adlerbacteria bacterium RIFCSPHIGHO2_02_FULL_54_18]
MKKHAGHILIAPRITEKGAYMAEAGVYCFNVAQDSSKRDVATAILDVYKVSPRKVTLVAIPRKRVMTRGTNRRGTTRGGKKAYVFLKKGDKIELA